MLNDFVELFLGAYYNFFPETYVHRQFFGSVLVVGVLLVLLGSAFLGVCMAFRALYSHFIGGLGRK